MIVGLAPAAHGGNRTGRVFTGDRSGDFLFAALYRAGLANQSVCVDAADGLALNDTRIVAAVRCAPPANAPTPGERAACAPWLDAEWRLVHASVRVIVALGGFAWRAALEIVRNRGGVVGSPVPRFGHGAVAELGEVTLIGCYHPASRTRSPDGSHRGCSTRCSPPPSDLWATSSAQRNKTHTNRGNVRPPAAFRAECS
jgi:uracil-DNA glycosylase family 4